MARKWWTLIAVSVATFMLLLDITVVNTALLSIQKDLGASFTDLQWVIDAYTLALAGIVLTAGAIADALGWRWVFFLNVPIGLGAIAVTFARLRESRDPNASRVDWLGLISFSTALLLLVLALVRGNEQGWGSPLILSLLGGAGL